VILGHLERQRTGREISVVTGLSLDLVRATIPTILRKITAT
jgi:hypothetical protein